MTTPDDRVRRGVDPPEKACVRGGDHASVDGMVTIVDAAQE